MIDQTVSHRRMPLLTAALLMLLCAGRGTPTIAAESGESVPVADSSEQLTQPAGMEPCATPFADADADGDVDQTDFGFLQRCLTVPESTLDPACACYDRDHDGRIASFDLEAFSVCLSGPEVAADSACDNWPGGLASDDFNAFNLDPTTWTIFDPLGDGTFSVAGTNGGDAALSIAVPARADHAIWTTGIAAPHVMQSVQDTPFEIEVRFASAVSRKYQRQGLLAQQDDDSFLTFETYSDGTATHVYAAVFHDGHSTEYSNLVVGSQTPGFLRLVCAGDAWHGSFSFDGLSWTARPWFIFNLQVARVGVFAGNENYAAAPAFTALVDYFRVKGLDLRNEDRTPAQDTFPPNIFNVELVPEPQGVAIRWDTDEPTAGTVQFAEQGGPVLGSIGPDPLTRSHFVRVPGLTDGIPYEFTITARDSANHVSERAGLTCTPGQGGGGPEITAWYGDVQHFGTLGTPQAAVDVLGNVSDPDGVDWLGYSLNGGPMVVLNRGPDTMRLAQAGDFNADLPYADLAIGPNRLLLRATDSLGNVKFKEITIHRASPTVWPLPYTIDWTQAGSINSVAQITDGLWAIEPGGVRPSVLAYDRLIAIGDVSWQNYEVTVPITVHAIDPGGYAPPSYGPGVGLLCRWPGHADDGGQPLQGIYPLGGIGLFRWTTAGDRFEVFGNNGAILAQAPLTDVLLFDVPYVFKMQVQTHVNTVAYRFKVWIASEPEPVGWKLIGSQAIANDPGAGSAVLLAHHVDALFGNVDIRPLSP